MMPRVSDTKYLVTATWDDAPHLSDREKRDLWDSIPPHQRDARSKGVPEIGKGAVWPISEERIICEPFKIPEFWPVAYGFDVGWSATAALWGAWDRSSDVVYVWSEYKVGQEKPPIHAEAIKARGEWIPGVIDPAARGRSQHDGVQLLEEYQKLGLDLDLADNRVEKRDSPAESMIHRVYTRMVEGAFEDFFDLCRVF